MGRTEAGAGRSRFTRVLLTCRHPLLPHAAVWLLRDLLQHSVRRINRSFAWSASYLTRKIPTWRFCSRFRRCQSAFFSDRRRVLTASGR